MAKYDLRRALVIGGKSGDGPQLISLKDGKRTVGSIKLHGRKAMLADTYSKLKVCVKEEDEIEGSIAGVTIVEGKLVSKSRKESWDSETMVEILDHYVKSEEELEVERQAHLEEAKKAQEEAKNKDRNGQKPAVAPAKP